LQKKREKKSRAGDSPSAANFLARKPLLLKLAGIQPPRLPCFFRP